MFQQLIESLRDTYSVRHLQQNEFSEILEQFGSLDVRCQLEQPIKQQLYNLLMDKTAGIVNYASIEMLVFEFLIQQPMEQPKQQSINVETIGQYAKKVPIDMLEELTNEVLQQLTNFYKLCVNRLNAITDYKEIERIGIDLQRQFKVDPMPILRYIQPIVDENNQVHLTDLLNLLNDLEKVLLQSARKSVNRLVPQQSKQQQVLNDSSDEERQQKYKRERLELANIVYQQVDALKQSKQIAKQKELNTYLNEIVGAVQLMEKRLRQLHEEADESSRRNDEIVIEREMMQVQLTQFDYDIKMKEAQMQQLLDDNEAFLTALTTKQDECTQLQLEISNMLESTKEITKIETNARLKQIEIDRLQVSIIQFQKESERLQLNNKALMQIIKEQEQNIQEQQTESPEQTKIAPIKLESYDTEQIDELTSQNNELNNLVESLRKHQCQLESQITDQKRELVHYKKMYESLNNDNAQLRTSIMTSNMRNSTMPQNRFSNIKGMGTMNRVSTFGMQNIGRVSGIGRASGIGMGRLSSIRAGQMSIRPKFGQLSDSIPFDQMPIHTIKEDDDCDVTFNQDAKQDIVLAFGKIFDKVSKQQGDTQEDYKYLEFDENALYARDFLGIRDEPKIADLLRKERMIHNKVVQRCFSDSIYRINEKGSKSRRIIFITESTFYIFEGEKRPTKLTRQFPLPNIHMLIFSETSPILCCFQVTGSDDYLMETFKRSELNTYLTEIFTLRQIALFQLEFKTTFTIKFKGQKDRKRIDDVHKHGYLDGGKMSAFKVSQLQGWLHIFTKKLFHKDWQEVFVLLTNVGLIVFKKPGDLEPMLFVSLVDALVIKNPLIEQTKAHTLKIRYEVSDIDFLFCATSSALLDQWHEMIQAAIMEQVKQQHKYTENQQNVIQKQRTKTIGESDQN